MFQYLVWPLPSQTLKSLDTSADWNSGTDTENGGSIPRMDTTKRNQSKRRRQKLALQYLTYGLVLFARLGSTHQLTGKCENDLTAISYSSWFSNMKNEKLEIHYMLVSI
jgi:hypothetical protein